MGNLWRAEHQSAADRWLNGPAEDGRARPASQRRSSKPIWQIGKAGRGWFRRAVMALAGRHD